MSVTEDVRVLKTKRNLVASMIFLLNTQSFKQITVNDICKEALVSRSTFYVHFEDKYELLREVLKKMRMDIDINLTQDEKKSRIKGILENIKKHANVFKNIFINDGTSEVQEMIFRNTYKNMFEISTNECEKIPQNLFKLFYAGGIINLVLWWIKNDFALPVDEIVGFLHKVSDNIAETGLTC